MTEQQDVLDPQRPRRRRIPVILLGALPAAIAATALISGSALVEPAAAAVGATGTGTVTPRTVTPGVVAPATSVDLTSSVQQITVVVPKVTPPPTPPTTSTKSSTSSKSSSSKSSSSKSSSSKSSSSKSSSSKSSSSKSSSSSSSITYKQFCADPSNPVSTSGTTGKALLAAVNKERAKIGIAPLSWSASMAKTATAWSQTMLANDLKTKDLIDGLAHNPNRPGAENVAVVYSSARYSATNAIKKMHKNLVYSNGHCLNLMNPKYTTMGAGVAGSDDSTTWYATENFR